MLIGVCGSICSGKRSVAAYLVEREGFSKLHLAPSASRTISTSSSSSDNGESHPGIDDGPNSCKFTNVQDLIDFATKRWQQRWVTTDVWDEEILEKLQRRPFFLLVSVDAPLSLRWQRCRAR